MIYSNFFGSLRIETNEAEPEREGFSAEVAEQAE